MNKLISRKSLVCGILLPLSLAVYYLPATVNLEARHFAKDKPLANPSTARDGPKRTGKWEPAFILWNQLFDALGGVKTVATG